ncbi:hypothetical protein [Brevibacillus centrosporus]|uniref:Uncharacterized protein n=1 Tax=Brevibacillus centrosporus TaxID=54910 RepID=A0A1I4C5F6_9BACL|nr:hypothetical protein [Brevibacillus centrosporus]MEC2128891.1 hypothetical protein [Brevibacillus centrosporus]MED4907656.1 hypothetical protein [Brevibacillus centrosporus]RNB67068.1 hypothetical protein EDM55_21230 [Brevibacillus centrosporus]SFK75617.1 hypothetical protein SAMN05518846_11950 [Brevibacillus centrosporus]GED35024.1 hypothetical protein BCE02nite_61650 [Brevibacillus centrosporus]
MRHLILTIGIAFLLTFTFTVFTPVITIAADPNKLVWHNLEITIKNKMQTDKPEERPVSLETYQQHSKSGKVITTQETQKVFGSPLYRPSTFRLPLVSSNGLYQQFFTIQNGKIGPSKPVLSHWDIFHKANEWVVVRQDVDQYTTDLLNRKETHRDEYPGYMKVMQIPGSDNFTLITPLGNGIMNLSMQILNPQGKVIRLQVIGNLTEKDMILLAAAYKPVSSQPK